MLDYNTIQNMIESASSMLGTLFYAMVLEKIGGGSSNGGMVVTIVALILTLLGLFFCFLGYRFRRIVGAFPWAVIAFTISGMVTGSSGLDSTVQILIAIVVGVAVGALCFRFQKAGTFLFCFLSAALLFFLLTVSMFDIAMGSGFSLSTVTPPLLVGLVYAIAAMKWTKPLMVLATAAFGGVAAGMGVALLMNINSYSTCRTIMIVAVAAGAIFQWVKSQPKAAAPAAPAQQTAVSVQQPVQPIQTVQPPQPQAPAQQDAPPAQPQQVAAQSAPQNAADVPSGGQKTE